MLRGYRMIDDQKEFFSGAPRTEGREEHRDAAGEMELKKPWKNGICI